MYSVSGKIKVKNETVKISPKFQKREFVLEILNEKGNQTCQFQLTQESCAILDNYVEGDSVTVQFNLTGREWKSPKGEIKFFNTLDVDSIIQDEAAKQIAQAEANLGTDDDLPF